MENKFIRISSISKFHQLSNLSKPKYPLISLINLNEVVAQDFESPMSIILDFYTISLKKCISNKIKYGQKDYDFDEGVMAFLEPGQVISTTDKDNKAEGWWLIFHPDFIRQYPLAKQIKEYGFFSYSVNEALHLSEKEENMIELIFKNIEEEYNTSIDSFSQDVMISQLELLLNYSNRFYNRQFITRKNSNNDLLIRLKDLLDHYFRENLVLEKGLPTVQYLADSLNISPNYLSDMLRNSTGQNTQQHIHEKIIELAKDMLTSTNLSVSEIAFKLGFEYPQSFSKLFKNKMNVTPNEFRLKFN
ncbi:helix-turn-helix domain-containing protein [Chryseobacterium gambrini]|uniref:helix-turn-helix domain-containing protein n=1 Tax=Chryseobacterium gambrini TaxID=373672 RepID=UPI0025B3AE6D|nr:AraC family transcriptional regulator [Chryseobacterium gambrini]MDN4029495.1 AraC family transcriptional regulator [Chryseobacterium gambrini]